MLTYASYPNLSEASTPPRAGRPSKASVRLAAMDADTLEFVLRMTADVAMLAIHIRRPLYFSTTPGTLGSALTASPINRTRAWRRLYVRTFCLLARFTADASPETLRGALPEAFSRLQQFVRENADLGRA